MYRSLYTTIWVRDVGIVGDTQGPRRSDEKPNKMVTIAYASAVDPNSVNDMTAYEKNGSVTIQLYNEKTRQ